MNQISQQPVSCSGKTMNKGGEVVKTLLFYILLLFPKK